MVIQNNIPGLNSKRLYNKNSSKLAKSLEKLSSGYSINRAADDAAGLAVSEKMRSQICGMKQSVKNCQDGISLIQTFEGALGETVAIIKRMKRLADQSANGTYDDNVDRNAIEIEYLHLCDEVNHIAETDFNGVVMLNGKPDSAARAAELELAVNSAVNESLRSLSPASSYADVPQTASVSDISMQAVAFAAPRAGGTTCGDFTVYGDSSDFSFDTVSGVLTILGGNVTVEGTGAATQNTIVVAKDKSANVTLRNVNIDVSTTNVSAFKIEDDSAGDVNITLEGNNTLKSGTFCAGLQKNGGANTGTLTINGDGFLNAHGSASGAGIGGSNEKNASNIKVISGNIIATSVDSNMGGYGAGIGSGRCGNASNITILGGNITATSDKGAGIGAGDSYTSYGNTTGGNAKGIYILGGTIVATSRDGSRGGISAGIGGDNYVSDIVIDGGEITAIGNTGIGGGRRSLTNVTINGGNITASGNGGAGIGSNSGVYGSEVEIVINGGTINSESISGAGIGGGYGQAGTNITINGGIVNAVSTGKVGAAGIGGGGCTSYASLLGANVDSSVTITGGSVNAISKYVNDDIGVVGELGEVGVGIGGGSYGQGIVTISGNETIVIAKGGESNDANADNIGSGIKGNTANVTINDGLISEQYTGGEIINGTIVHYKGGNTDNPDPDKPNPPKPIIPDEPNRPDKLIVSIPNAFGNASAKLTYTDNLILQTGARTKDAVNFTFAYSSNGIGGLAADLNCTAKGLGVDTLTLKTQESANYAIDKLDHALNKVSMIRATFGAAQNRLEHKIDNLNNTTENLTAAESLIRDTDMAKEMMNFTKNQILMQSSQSMLAQANSLPQQVMSLISG